ncbi:hypothetical protein EDD29_0732 [Actinocorallia herbida]|uniref:Uncharacterized protein n=1 Tax=Actinocorallia herbida TaxID=58109 RepID=A0A3N1CPI4_9ACTN|nr:hypothetical protein [Actinocorallia herbida]ROO83237.1 hypothetical protein EDD29_0732 [Actinocorallia herbida]
MSTVTEYAAAVRAALADIPQTDRDELLEDLEEHLAEVAAEHDGPLEDRLGTPQAYAAELRAAYTDAVPVKRRAGLRDLFGSLERRTQTVVDGVLPRGSAARDVAHDLRPVWWVARGYFAAFLLNAILGRDQAFLPDGPLSTLVLLGAVTVSVWLGGRARRGGRRRAATVLGVAGLTGLALLGGMAFAATAEDGRAYYGPGYEGTGPSLGDLANIYVFTRDGKPVKDVLLYDQWGEPIQTSPDAWGFIERGGDPLQPNVYPKEICAPGGMESTVVPLCPDAQAGSPAFPDSPPTFPAVAPTMTAPEQPGPTDSPSTSPSPSGSASPTASPSPTVTPTASPTE